MTGQKDRFNGHGKILRDIENYVPEKLWDVIKLCRYKLGIPKVAADGPF